MIQSGGFFARLFVSFLKAGLPLMKNVIKPLAKSVLILLGLTAAASVADAGIHKKNLSTILIISKDQMEHIIKIFEFLQNSGLLLKEVSETNQNQLKSK